MTTAPNSENRTVPPAYHWAFDSKGGFIVCSLAPNYAYAYPSSEYAVAAARDPRATANRMAEQADKIAASVLQSVGGEDTLRLHNDYLRGCMAQTIAQNRDREERDRQAAKLAYLRRATGFYAPETERCS
jgi:hypothetical protein